MPPSSAMFGQVQVTFKVFTHWNEESKPEVRRFGVDKNTIASFQMLNEKFHEVFPGLRTKKYAVSWIDEEGDDITISSDQEVLSALSPFIPNGAVIKFHIYVNEDEGNEEFAITAVKDSPTVGPSNLCHRGVTCDGCNSSVVGYRYKCASCDDFDLCSKCEASGRHSEHCMVRIPSPLMPHTMVKNAIKKSRHFFKMVTNDNTNKRNQSLNGTSWLADLAIVLNELANLARNINQNSEKQPGNQSGTDMETTGSNKKICNSKDSVSWTSNAVTKPFVVGSNKENEKKGLSFEFVPKFYQLKPTTNDNDKPIQRNSSGVVFNSPEVPVSLPKPAVPTLFSPFGITNPQVNGQPQRSIFAPTDQQRHQFGSFGWGSNSSGPNTVNTSAFGQLCVEGPNKNSMPAQAFGIPNGFGTYQQTSGMLFGSSAPQKTTHNTNPEAVLAVKPEPTTAQESEPAPHHPRPHINNAIKQIMAMGFTNDGGWLTQLVESEDGNIEAVLDYLPQPTKPM